jgi:hypothetical protein
VAAALVLFMIFPYLYCGTIHPRRPVRRPPTCHTAYLHWHHLSLAKFTRIHPVAFFIVFGLSVASLRTANLEPLVAVVSSDQLAGGTHQMFHCHWLFYGGVIVDTFDQYCRGVCWPAALRRSEDSWWPSDNSLTWPAMA